MAGTAAPPAFAFACVNLISVAGIRGALLWAINCGALPWGTMVPLLHHLADRREAALLVVAPAVVVPLATWAVEPWAEAWPAQLLRTARGHDPFCTRH